MHAGLVVATILAGAVAAGCGTEAGTTPTLAPTATLTPASQPAVTPVPDASAEPGVIVTPEFRLPPPLCPAPLLPVDAPRLRVTSEGAPVVDAVTGSLRVTTCSTVREDEFTPAEPSVPLPVAAGGVLTWSVQPGWRIVAWEAWDRPRGGEGMNVFPTRTTPDWPRSIDVDVWRDVDSVVGVRIWAVTDDGHATAETSGSAWADVP